MTEQSTDYVNRDLPTTPVRCRVCCLHSIDPCHDHPSGQGMGCRQNLEPGFFEHPELDQPGPLNALNALAAECHAANQHWWHDPRTGERLDRNKGELLMLIVSEVAEAMEGERKNLMDDKLPHRKMAEVELADVLVRVFDYAGAFQVELHEYGVGDSLNDMARFVCQYHGGSNGRENKGAQLFLIVKAIAAENLNLALWRLFDYAGAYGFDLDGAVREKRAFNATRADHKAEARLAPGGKAF